MKKVLIVIDTLYGGGAERVACRIANALSVDNEVVIYTRSTPDRYQIAENIKVLNFTYPPRLLTYRGRGVRFVEPILAPINNLYWYRYFAKKLKDIKQKELFTCLKYHEISVKDNKGIDAVFEDIFKYYFNRKIDSICQTKNEEYKNINNINDLNLNEENNKIKKPCLDKSIFVYHQMLDKMKKEIYIDMSSVKQGNKDEKDKNKALEEKINKLTNQFISENQLLKDKLNIIENKNISLEQQIKLKDKEIQELKQKINDLIISTKAINLKFKISSDNAKDEISIKAKGESKISEVLSTLYDIYPYIKNYNIKGFCLEGNENEKIDAMKTVNENNLVNGSLIVLMV
jgi:hypothetical protein